MADVEALGRSLRALAEGDLGAWQPVPLDASVADVRAAAPDGEAGPGIEWLFGQPATTWRLPSSPGAPFGIVIWLQGDLVTLVEVRDPTPLDAPEAVLGAPEAVLPSGLGATQEQQLWPGRGLVIHVDRVTGQLTRLYGHEASTVDAIAASPLAAVRIDRVPRQC